MDGLYQLYLFYFLFIKFLISENSGQFAGDVIEFNDKHQPISIERVLINDDHPYRAS